MRFLLEQKITPLVNRYDFYSYDGGQKGAETAFVEQKRFSFKEMITFYRDNSKNDVIFTLKAEKVLDVHGKFIVHDNSGSQVGYLQKAFAKSLLRSSWIIADASGKQLFEARERSLPIALVRRFGGFVPVVGELLEQLPFNFDFIVGEKVVGRVNRNFKLRDSYDIEIDDKQVPVDERLIMALGVALDALQSR